MVVFKRLLTLILVLAAFTLSEPAAHANTISVNGSCVVGDCANPDVLPEGMMFNAPFSFTYTFANSDRYLLSGNVFGAFGVVVWHENVSNFQTTYLGNDTGTASGEDVLVADFGQVFFVPHRIFPTTEPAAMFGSFGPGVGAGSSISGQYTFIGVFPLLGPFTQPPDEFSGSVLRLMGGGGLDPVNWEFVVRFGEGSQVGSSIVTSTSPIPEPSSLALLGGGAMMAGLAGLRRRFRRE